MVQLVLTDLKLADEGGVMFLRQGCVMITCQHFRLTIVVSGGFMGRRITTIALENKWPALEIENKIIEKQSWETTNINERMFCLFESGTC